MNDTVGSTLKRDPESSHPLQTAPAGLDTSFNWSDGSSFLISLHSSLHLCCLAPRSNQSDLRTVPVRPFNLLKALCWLPAHSNTPIHGSLVSSSVRLLHICSIHSGHNGFLYVPQRHVDHTLAPSILPGCSHCRHPLPTATWLPPSTSLPDDTLVMKDVFPGPPCIKWHLLPSTFPIFLFILNIHHHQNGLFTYLSIFPH